MQSFLSIFFGFVCETLWKLIGFCFFLSEEIANTSQVTLTAILERSRKSDKFGLPSPLATSKLRQFVSFFSPVFVIATFQVHLCLSYVLINNRRQVMLTARIRDALLPIFAVGGLIRILFLLGPRDLVLISCMASFLFRIKHTTTPSSSFRGIDTLLFCLPTHSSFFPIPSALSFFFVFFLRNCVASKRWERWERSKGHVRLARARIAENKCDCFTLKGLPWRHARRNGWLNYLHFILTSRFADTWCSV